MATLKTKGIRRAAAKKRAVTSATHVAIIGAGKGGTALMEIFAQDPLVRIVGIASREQARQLAVQLEGRFASGKPWIATD